MTAPASETAAQIAARYGLPLAPGAAVRQIPRGTSGQPLPVWRGNALRYPDPEDQRNRMRRMRKTVKENNVYRWGHRLLKELNDVRQFRQIGGPSD